MKLETGNWKTFPMVGMIIILAALMLPMFGSAQQGPSVRIVGSTTNGNVAVFGEGRTLRDGGAGGGSSADKVDVTDGTATNLNLTAAFYLSYESATNFVQWTYNTASNRVEIIEVENGTTNTYYDLTD